MLPWAQKAGRLREAKYLPKATQRVRGEPGWGTGCLAAEPGL